MENKFVSETLYGTELGNLYRNIRFTTIMSERKKMYIVDMTKIWFPYLGSFTPTYITFCDICVVQWLRRCQICASFVSVYEVSYRYLCNKHLLQKYSKNFNCFVLRRFFWSTYYSIGKISQVNLINKCFVLNRIS